jgi:hypothetical protein
MEDRVRTAMLDLAREAGSANDVQQGTSHDAQQELHNVSWSTQIMFKHVLSLSV